MFITDTKRASRLACYLFMITATACNTNTKAPEQAVAKDTTSVIVEKKEEPKTITEVPQDKLHETTYLMVAANMLERVINNQDVAEHIEILKSADPEKLQHTLNSDELRMCFWINVYNAFSQYYLKADTSLYQSDRNKFFKRDTIFIAGFDVSMNDIEHGVLRRGATIWSKGLIRIPFKNEFVRKFKMENVDYRIHFALNCGAKSCPPICIYLPSRTDEQLNLASRSYLQKECELKKENEKSIIMVPALLTWFSEDFGSKDDKRDILRKYGVIGADADPKIDYKDYDWTLKIQNYKQF